MEVFLANEQELPVDEERLTLLARHVLSHENLGDSAELSVLFVGAEHIRNLNARYAGDDHATDVLAFPMLEDEEDEDDNGAVLGDVVICPQIAQDNAGKLNHDLGRELDVLLVHGTLHLLGFDHQNDEDKAKMEARLDEILRSFAPSPN